MKIILYAKGQRAFSVLKGMIKNKFAPILIILENEETAIKDEASKIGILCKNDKQVKGIDHIDEIKSLEPDIILSVGFSKILPKNLIEIPKIESLNCHAGKLPEYRGASPIPWQIINGEIEGECNILRMKEGIDDGEIFYTEKYNIEPADNASTITQKVNEIFERTVPIVLRRLKTGKFECNPQKNINATIWTRRKKTDGLISFKDMNAKQIENLVRALNEPYPGAYFNYKKDTIKINRVSIPDIKYKGVPGRYVGKRDGQHIVLAKDRGIAIDDYSTNGNWNDLLESLPYGTDLL